LTGSRPPIYRRTADEILAMLADGRLELEFTVPEAAKLTGVKDWAARKAAEHLAERGLVESQQGTGYRALVTRDEAAALQVDDRSVREQIAELQQDIGDLRQRLGRMEASLATLTGKPRGGKRDQAKAAADGGRR
jgi:DNA-binding transcriptional regulator YhcF (GntR family)